MNRVKHERGISFGSLAAKGSKDQRILHSLTMLPKSIPALRPSPSVTYGQKGRPRSPRIEKSGESNRKQEMSSSLLNVPSSRLVEDQTYPRVCGLGSLKADLHMSRDWRPDGEKKGRREGK